MAKNKYKATSVNKHLGKGKKRKYKSGKQPIRNNDPEVYLDKFEKKFNVEGTNTCRTQTKKENISGNSTQKTD